MPTVIPPSAPSLALEVIDLTKTFVGGRALDRVDLQVSVGEVHALLGENGSGKSTLIKVLSGYHAPDPGAVVYIGGRALVFESAHSAYELGARFVHQDLGLVEDSSITDNLAFGPGFPTKFATVLERAARTRARQALADVGLDLDPRMKVSRLSPAEKTGVALARALMPDEHASARLLVLDEPTARLPEEEVEALLAMVRIVSQRGVGVLYVTHRLDEVFELAERATVLRDGQRVITAPVAGLTRDTLLQHLFGEMLERPRHRQGTNAPVVPAVLRVTNLRSEVLHGVSLEVRPGEIVGIAGITSSGREALCATVFGARTHDAGRVEIQGFELPPFRPDVSIGHGVAFVPAERKLGSCFLDLTARENVTVSSLRDIWRIPLLRRRAEASLVRNWFERLGVRPATAVNAPMSSFSGGNQQKIVYGRWFQRRPVLFLLDEPTQGVDVAAKAELHRALFQAAEGGAGVLVSSTDVDELVTICDRVLVLLNGRVAATVDGADLNPHTLTSASLGMNSEVGRGAA